MLQIVNHYRQRILDIQYYLLTLDRLYLQIIYSTKTIRF